MDGKKLMTVSSFIRSVLGKPSRSPTENPTDIQAVHLPVHEPSELRLAECEERFYQTLFASRGDAPLSMPQKLAINVVKDSLARKDYRLTAIPRLPTVVPKLLRSLRDPDSSARDYVAIINKDPVMSAAVLKLANSAYFNPINVRIGDIERAIVKLGLNGLRSVLSAAVMQPIIQRDSPYFSQTGKRLWAHSLNTAVACEIVGHARRMERFKAYLMGLVHDIGKITLFSELCKQYKLNGDTSPSPQAFIPPLQTHATQLSALIAKDWQLPEDICRALEEQVAIAPGKQVSPLGHLLYQANMTCEAYAFTPRANTDSLQFLIADFALPKNLFHKLDDVATRL